MAQHPAEGEDEDAEGDAARHNDHSNHPIRQPVVLDGDLHRSTSQAPASMQPFIMMNGIKRGEHRTLCLQSEPPKPSAHSQAPRLQTPWPEQKLRSKQESVGITRSVMQLLQHSEGAIGTYSPNWDLLQYGKCQADGDRLLDWMPH